MVLNTSGQDGGVGFTAATSGNLYLGLKLKIASAQATGDYFTCFNSLATSSATYNGRVYVKRGSTASKFLIGLLMGNTGATVSYGTQELDVNTEYVLIFRYNINAGTLNDTGALYINPTSTTEASNSPYLNTVTWAGTSAEITSYAAVSLRQGSASNAAAGTISRMLVTNNWADLSPLISSAPTIGTSVVSLTSFTTVAGTASTSQNFTVSGTALTADISVSAPSNFEVSTDDATFSSSATLTQSGGSASGIIYTRIAASAPAGSVSGNITLSSTGATNKTVALSGTVNALNAPLLDATPASLTGFSTSAGVVSAAQTFSASGTNLTGNITITAPSGYEVATSGSYGPTVILTPSSGTVLSTVISVRISTAAAAGSASGNVAVTSTGATTVNVAVSGTVSPAVTINYVSLTAPGAAYTQNFDALPTTTITGAFSGTIGLQGNFSTITSSSTLNGWYGVKNNGNITPPVAAVNLTADTGTGSSGGMFSYGAAAASDRALGMLASGTNTMTFGTLVKNDSGSTLTGLTFSFTAEFWRNSTAVQNILAFAYGKINGTTFTNDNFLTASGATTFPSLDLNGPAFVGANGALDGNLPANKTAVVSVTLPISLAAGEVAFLRWSDFNDGGSDAGIAMDDLTMVGEDSTILVPTVSLPGGSYYTNQTVFVSNYASYAAGETLRYTTDGSDPIATSPAYNNGTGITINIGAGTKILKVAAFTTGGARSNVSTSTYFLPLDVADLTALRASPTGTTIYRVLGQVTFTASLPTRNTKFFQDSGAGIQIDDFSTVVTSTYTVGDNVANIIGSISTFNGQLQFTPKVDFGTAISSGNAVVPLSRTLATLTDADQARLVSVTGVTFSSAGSVFATAPSFTSINDGSAGTFQNLFGTNTPSGLEITGATIPVGPNTVTGVIQKTSITSVLTITVAPRSMADIVYTGPPLITVSTSKTTLLEGATGVTEESPLTVARTGSTASTLVVDITESTAGALLADISPDGINYPGYAVLPSTVTILAGQSSATIYVVAKNDAIYTGTRNATLTAASAGFISGTKVYTITDDDTPTNIYSSWANTNAGSQGAAADFDKDGVSNGVEYFFGATGSSFTTSPQLVANKISFPKDSTATSATGTIQTSPDLINWTPVTADTSVPGFISYTLLPGQGKIFVRLNVVVTP
ncbi:MAG: FN3 associated domain-containing protein [Luteolibacter sp.]